MKWMNEAARYPTLSVEEKWKWLAALVYALSVVARGSYPSDESLPSDNERLLRICELIHRTASQLQNLALSHQGMGDEQFMRLLTDELNLLHVDSAQLLEIMFPSATLEIVSASSKH